MLIEDLYNKHKAELTRFARAVSRDEKEAEDLLQETFLRALAHTVQLGGLPDYKQRAWMYKVLKNLLYDRRRRERFEVPMEEQHEPTIDFDGQSGIEIHELLERLSPKLREIVYKRFWLGMTSKQIAGLLCIPAATVRFRLHTAMNLLRNQLKNR